ncbi:MAG: phosphonate degradation HD-domain oxygenase [Amphritea sp.]
MSGQNSQSPIIEKIIRLFSDHGGDWYMGEPVTMAQHMLQSAYFAENAGADDELIIAALLHDIGHYTSEYAEDCLQRGIDNEHEDAAAAFLDGHFSARVVDPIRLHVATKRYLCATKPIYYNVLSEASKQSLKVQGGPMNEQDVAKFESEPNYQDAIRVRHWDEAGKEADLSVPELDHYIPMLERLLIN